MIVAVEQITKEWYLIYEIKKAKQLHGYNKKRTKYDVKKNDDIDVAREISKRLLSGEDSRFNCFEIYESVCH